mmetsp:Transcript_17039/g.51075  ORF Transcript_17039/g.51075 Transcript_17039/m.51075 type:complete len:221 (-) Transcript_17039:830-1492(-)
MCAVAAATAAPCVFPGPPPQPKPPLRGGVCSLVPHRNRNRHCVVVCVPRSPTATETATAWWCVFPGPHARCDGTCRGTPTSARHRWGPPHTHHHYTSSANHRSRAATTTTPIPADSCRRTHAPSAFESALCVMSLRYARATPPAAERALGRRMSATMPARPCGIAVGLPGNDCSGEAVPKSPADPHSCPPGEADPLAGGEKLVCRSVASSRLSVLARLRR